MDIPKIQWYPGHIAKAEKKLSEVINKVDLVIEVRDSRIPLSTGHPHLNKWINNCLLYTSPSPRDYAASRMPSSA